MRRIGRRALLELLAGAAAFSLARPGSAGEDELQALARLLSLAPGEEEWLDSLTPTQRQELLVGLRRGGMPDAPTLALAVELLGRRSRLFPFVGYPRVADRRSVCDGLVRE